MTPGVTGGGFDFSVASVGGTWSWRVTANNVKDGSQYFYVQDVVTPFGPLSTVDSPIPGDVVRAMADSVLSFSGQVAPLLVLSGPSSFSVTVSEGTAPVDAGTAVFTNAGAFASFMSVSGTPSEQWLQADPALIAGIGRGQTGQIVGRVYPTAMLAAQSPYTGYLNLQDNRAVPTVIPVRFDVTVLPRPAISLDLQAVNLSFDTSSQSPVPAVTVNVENSGPATSLLNFTVGKIQDVSPWLCINPRSAGPVASGASVPVLLTVESSRLPRIPGLYTDTLTFVSINATNSPVNLPVALIVS